MRYFRWFVLAFIFSISAFTGFNAGQHFDIGWDLSSGIEQHNILIISTEDINQPDSSLKSVWLLIFYTDLPRVDLLPIFPDIREDAGLRNKVFADSFSLTPDREPSATFWDQMNKLNTWWDGYIILDDTATASLIAFMDGNNGFSTQYSSQIISDIPHWGEDPQTALEKQTEMYRVHCQRFTIKGDFQDFLPLILNLHHHALTDLNHGQIIGTWRLLQSYNETLNCAFPTITASVR